MQFGPIRVEHDRAELHDRRGEGFVPIAGEEKWRGAAAVVRHGWSRRAEVIVAA